LIFNKDFVTIEQSFPANITSHCSSIVTYINHSEIILLGHLKQSYPIPHLRVVIIKALTFNNSHSYRYIALEDINKMSKVGSKKSLNR